MDAILASNVARLLIGVLFIVSGIPKLLDWRAFAQAVGRFGLLPQSLVPPFAVLLPSAELVVGVSLLTAIQVKVGLLVALGMLAMFTSVLTIALVRGEEHDCGCFGRLPIKQHGRVAIGRNVVLIGLSMLALWPNL